MNTQTDTTQINDYTLLTAALETYTTVSNKLAELEACFQSAMAELIAEVYKEDFAALQKQQVRLQEQIETYVLKNPQWFAKVKTLKTPFGTIALRTSTKLSVPNEEATIALLEMRKDRGQPFLRSRQFLSLESLEALDDAELAPLKVRRITQQNIRITPAKVDLGKAVATQAKKEKK